MSIKNIAEIRIMKNRLIEERKRLGLNQDQMAEIGGVAKRTYCDYESGVSEPKASFFIAIAAAGADVQYILTGLRAVPSVETLSPRKKALLDNYENTDDRGREAIEQLASAQAEYQPTKKRAKGGE